MAYNGREKLETNIAAIRIALGWKKGQRVTPEEIGVLKGYSGFGGLKAVLFPYAPIDEWIKLNASKEDLGLYPAVMELHEVLKNFLSEQEYDKAVKSIRNSILTAYYTPAVVPQVLYEVLKKEDLQPQRLYEPSSGAGIFITEAATAFDSLQKATAVEKDFLSGKVLTALAASLPFSTDVQITPFEQSSNKDNETYDLIASNIPFGNFRVFDKAYPESITGKIHNYFFAKGLGKLRNGGLLAFITTDAFLNSPSNKEARQYLFSSADFISVAVLPDNLMKDTGNTEAPSHLLIVQRNDDKQDLTDDEKLLVNTVANANEYGDYSINRYIANHPDLIVGSDVKAGKDQYGKAHQAVWQQGDVADIAKPLADVVQQGIAQRVNRERFAALVQQKNAEPQKPRLTYLPLPQSTTDVPSMQLGLFDAAPAEGGNRASAYISDLDQPKVDQNSARILNIVRTADKPDHEPIVLLAAKALAHKYHVYKLISNVEELRFPAGWMNETTLQNEIAKLPERLRAFDHRFYNDGEAAFHGVLSKNETELITEPNPLHREGTLIVHNGHVGALSYAAGDEKYPGFVPSLQDKKDLQFYELYTAVRDDYLRLY